jgi:PelA/Pel-15E family pectate lyase
MKRLLIIPLLLSNTALATTPSISEVREALVKAVTYFHANTARHGGYVYKYSGDFTLREAEGIPGPDTIWIQPPGTPAVGDVALDVYEVTSDKRCLDVAIEAARALSRTQLESGGWDYSGHFDDKSRSRILYRRTANGELIRRQRIPQSEAGWHVWKSRKHKDTNFSTLDDDVTQSATRLLLRVDAALDLKDAEVHEAAQFAVQALMAAQYPNGAWSASFDTFPSQPAPAEKYPVRPATYPADWPRAWPKDFTGCYVLNDNLHATAIRTLYLASVLHQNTGALAAAKKAGDFLLLAQMPDPQPAWAQQYDADMHPAWSRAFEPSSICGRESQAVMWVLLKLAMATGDHKYLQPIPKAVSYLRGSLLPDGKIARFYELQTNKPLYFERGQGGKGFVLTHDDRRASSNYGWTWDSELDAIEAAHADISKGARPVFPPTEKERWNLPPTDKEVAEIMAAMNADGAWVEHGDERGFIRDAAGKKQSPAFGVIHSDTFVQNVRALAAWLKAKKA